MVQSAWKVDFPIFTNQPRLAYFDTAATALKPKPVLEAMSKYYTHYSANVHRGIYDLANQATAAFEQTRNLVSDFINANSPDSCVLTTGTTHGLNMLALSLGFANKTGDVVVTLMDHHSNFVPWQQMAKRGNHRFRVIPVGPEGSILSDEGMFVYPNAAEWIQSAQVVAFPALSNTLGAHVPVRALVRAIRAFNDHCVIVVDAAQAVVHAPINVQEWGADAVVFSGHKLYGPTGVGVLWLSDSLRKTLEPSFFGGEMVQSVSETESTWKEALVRFEAGTPSIASVIGLGAAIEYIQDIGFDALQKHEKLLVQEFTKSIADTFPGEFGVIGPALTIPNRAGTVSFTFAKGPVKAHPHDIAQVLDEEHVCIRAGHHCTMPLHTSLHIPASARVSLGMYNTSEDIHAFIRGLKRVKELFL